MSKGGNEAFYLGVGEFVSGLLSALGHVNDGIHSADI